MALPFASKCAVCCLIGVLVACGKREASDGGGGDVRTEGAGASESVEARDASAGPEAGTLQAAGRQESAASPEATEPVAPEASLSEVSGWVGMREELARSPLDIERLVDGILEKYELDALETAEDLLEALLERYEAGDRSVAVDLGILIAYGDPSVVDPSQAKLILEEAVVEGEVRALSELGRLYLSGNGVLQDAAMARGYFEQGMEAGDPEAAFLLGMGWRNGVWGEVDDEEGITMLETAAQLGHVAAANTLFDLIWKETGESGRDRRSVGRLADYRAELAKRPELEAWLGRGVSSGDVPSILHLAQYHQYTGDAPQAVALLQMGAELGSFTALKKLMGLSARGLLESDYRASMRRMLEPHLLGPDSPEAMLTLAFVELMEGPEKLDAALSLLDESAAQGYHRAEVARDSIRAGEIPPKAVLNAMRLDDAEAYLSRMHDKDARRVEDAETAAGEASQSDQPPRVLQMATPDYPLELKSEGISGRVLVEMVVDIDGTVAGARVAESSHLGFEASALETARAMTFQPARRNGETVPSKVRIPIIFKPGQ